MKITLKNPSEATPAPSPAPAPAPAGDAKAAAPKLKFKTFAPNEPAEAPKPKRKYTKKPKVDADGQPLPPGKPGPKKRAREEAGDVAPPAAKRKPKPTAKSLERTESDGDDDEDENDHIAVAAPAPRSGARPARTQSVKLSFKPKAGGAAPQRGGTAILKVKGAGKPPPRPPGAGYDSEADEAELDPAIESQFVLRMLPGNDCQLLKTAIEEKTIGKSMSQGGPGVHFRFFDRDGRRAMVTVQGRHYAASMVELPCVVESMKSWNKKDWVKTADICQMLLVLGRVQNEEEAKKHPRPREVEPESHRYPHGLTPPMQWVRKRRFRPRKSYLDVERIENQTEALLDADENADAIKYDLVSSDHDSEADSEEDAEGDLEEDMMDTTELVETPAEEVMDPGDLEQMLHAGLMEEDEVEVVQADADGEPVDLDNLFHGAMGNSDTATTVEVDAATPTTAHEVAMHALGHHQQNGTSTVVEPETAASTPANVTSPDDDDDDAESDEDAEVDEAAAEELQRKEQVREEIKELEQSIKQMQDQYNGSTNTIYKQRLQQRIQKQMDDLNVKRTQLGEDED